MDKKVKDTRRISDLKLQAVTGFNPHVGQNEILRCASREITIAAGRRWGKSAVCAYLALKTILEDNKRVWIVAPTYDLTHKVFEYVVRWYGKCLPSQTEGVSYKPYPRIRTPRGSILECRSTDSPTGLLGEEVDLEIVDEAARIPRHIYDTYLYPVTSSRQGRILKISTPFGKNWFYEHWVRDKATDGSFSFPSNANPHFPSGEWERAREMLPEQVFRQEYQALFLEEAASVFRGIPAVVGDTLEDVRPDHRYVMGVDLGRINDFTVLTMMDLYSHNVVAWERFKEISWPLQKLRIKALCDRYNRARVIMDSTGIGDPVSEDLRQDGYFIEDYKLSRKSKQQLIEKLALFIEQKAIGIPENDVLIDELSAYSYSLPTIKEGGSPSFKYGAPIGLHDDCVTSLALAVWGLQDTKTYRKERGSFPFFSSRKNKKPLEYGFI